jgi:hypothetical protein
MIRQLAEAICLREAALRGEQSVYTNLWQELSDYLWPEKAEFTVQVSPGVVRNRGLLDSTGARSLELFGSFLHNMLNNPDSKWFGVGASGAGFDFAKDVSIRSGIEETERTLMEFMSHPTSRLYQNLHVNYLDLGAYGTSCIFAERIGRFFRTEDIHLANFVFEEDAFGFPNAVFRRHEFNHDQARQRFGRNALTTYEGTEPDQGEDPAKASEKKVKFVHAVFPSAPQAYMLAQKVPEKHRGDNFVSVWVNTETKRVVDIKGEQTHPYTVARWYRNGRDKWGRSPGMTALPDIRMANRMMDTILRGAEKIVDPPLFVRDGSLMSPLRLFPGGLTFGDGDPPSPLIPPGASRIEMGNALLEQRQQAVRDAFFIPLFATPDSPVKTATQVLQEVDERNRAISPMIVRLQEELHSRLIERAYDLGVQAGAVAPLPEQLLDAGVRIEYKSPLSASRHQLEALGTIRMFEGLALLAQIDPEVFDEFDAKKAALVIHAGSGAPFGMRRSEAEKRQLRAQRAAAEQQAAALQAASQAVIPAVEATAKMMAAQR